MSTDSMAVAGHVDRGESNIKRERITEKRDA